MATICFCCASECQPDPHGVGTGVAMFRGQPYCYDCAGEREAADFLNSSIYSGHYTSKDGRATITTWTGRELARVFETWTGRHNMARRMRYWRAVDEMGRVWYGKFSDDWGQLTTTRKAVTK